LSGADAVGLDVSESTSGGVYLVQYRTKASREVGTLKSFTYIHIYIYIYKKLTATVGRKCPTNRENANCKDDEAKVEGRIRPGRPRTKWSEEMNKDARVVGIRPWLSATLDRNEWCRLLMEARTR